MEDKITIGKVKPFVETFGFLKDLYELVEFAFKAFSRGGVALAAIYWLSTKMSLGLEYVPSVIWVVGSVAFWLLLGWLVPLVELARFGLGHLFEALAQLTSTPESTTPSNLNGSERVFTLNGNVSGTPRVSEESIRKAAEEYYKSKGQPMRIADKSAFKTFHWAPIIALIFLGSIMPQVERKFGEQKATKVFAVIYCLFFFIFGLWYAFAYPYGPDTPYASLIMIAGSLSMVWLVIYGVVLLVRLVRRVRPPLSSNEAPKE